MSRNNSPEAAYRALENMSLVKLAQTQAWEHIEKIVPTEALIQAVRPEARVHIIMEILKHSSVPMLLMACVPAEQQGDVLELLLAEAAQTRWIRLRNAIHLTGHPTEHAFRKYVLRWNMRNPGNEIAIDKGRADYHALQAALVLEKPRLIHQSVLKAVEA